MTFEWILLLTLIAIGIVGAVSAVRDALITELGDVSGAAVNIDQSYTVIASSCLDEYGDPMGTAFSYVDTLPACTGTGVRPDAPPVTQVKSSCTP